MAPDLRGYMGNKIINRDENRQATPPPSAQPQASRIARGDRGSAASFKVKRNEKLASSSQSSHVKVSSSAAGYYANTNGTQQNAPQNHQYHDYDHSPPSTRDIKTDPQFQSTQQRQVPMAGTIFDATMTSGFDDTKSEALSSEGRRSVDEYDEDGDYDDRYGQERDQYQRPQSHQQFGHTNPSTHPAQHALQLQQGKYPLNESRNQHPPFDFAHSKGFTGRFQHSTNASPTIAAPAIEHWEENMPVRTGSALRAPAADSREVFTGDTASQNDERDLVYEEQIVGQEELPENEDEEMMEKESPEQTELPKQRDDTIFRHLDIPGDQDGVEPRSEGGQSARSAGSRVETRREASHHLIDAADRFKLDHTDEELEQIKYTDLKKETWDQEKNVVEKSTRKKRPKSPQPQDDGLSIAEYIEHAILEKNPEEQAKAFAEMSMHEYEEAGDYLIAKFAELMNGIKDARKKKRAVVMKFEDEIEAREKAVRGKSDIFDRKFRDMKAGGEDVLRDTGGDIDVGEKAILE